MRPGAQVRSTSCLLPLPAPARDPFLDLRYGWIFSRGRGGVALVMACDWRSTPSGVPFRLRSDQLGKARCLCLVIVPFQLSSLCPSPRLPTRTKSRGTRLSCETRAQSFKTCRVPPARRFQQPPKRTTVFWPCRISRSTISRYPTRGIARSRVF